MRMWIVVVVGACGGGAATAPVTTDIKPKQPKPPIIDLAPSHAAITALAVGGRHTCALHADGTVSCWGANAGRQLGVAGAHDRARPVRVPGIADAVELTIDGDLTCVRRSAGAVTCWGELGDKGFDGAPETIAFSPAIQISGRCVLTTNRDVECLPRNGTTPAQLQGLSDVVQLSSRNDRGCVLQRGGMVTCFQNNVIWRVPHVARAVEVAVGSQIACARMHSGAVRCWQIGYAEEIDVTATKIKDARTIVASDYEVCAIRRNGHVGCDVRDGGRVLPEKAIAELRGVSMLAIGLHACAIARGGLTCFGQDSNGELGIGWGHGQPMPVRLPGIDDAVAVTASSINDQRTCVVRRGGGVTCFGNTVGEANPSAIVRDVAITDARAMTASVYIGMIDPAGALWNAYGRDKPERIEHLPAVRAVSGECAISTTNELWCFGTLHPVKADVDAGPIPGAIDVVSVSAPTADHACFVRTSGAALCYQAPDHIAPLDVADARDIAVGYNPEDRHYNACVLRTDRTVACIDDADGTFAFAPLRDVDYLRDVRGIAVGAGFACAVVGNGTVSCWGDNRVGQLGDGTFEAHRRPAPVAGIHDAVAVTAGLGHACALHRDHTVSCWGDALAGQLGTFATASIEQPQHVTAFDD